MSEPIAITGLGAVTPLGTGSDALNDGWQAGICALVDGFGHCSDFDPTSTLTRSEIRRTDRHVQMALTAAQEAVDQAGWGDGLPYEQSRIGCVVSTATGGQRTIEGEFEAVRLQGPKAVAALRVMLSLPNAAAVCIALRFGLQGECFGLQGACAGGTKAIGAGVRMIRSGAVDAMIVGGAEGQLGSLVDATYRRLGAVSPSGQSRPFDRRRDGMVPAEGAGILVLERASAARERGATILAEVLGYGAGNDAYHLTVPDVSGQVRAMRAAISDADIEAAEITYVNAHGSGTLLNDSTETTALKTVLGTHAYSARVSSLKSAIGHLQGAAGAVEAIATVGALRAGVAPPTLGLEQHDAELDLDYVPLHKRPLPLSSTGWRIAMSNSFGLGGHNACLVLQAS
jgi:3-oxoacyl-[acyl-carrier-protein] synthase II